MNLDYNKVKELISLYSELDDEYQEILMQKAWDLYNKQQQKNQLLESEEKFKSKDDLEEKVNEKAHTRAKEIYEILQLFEKMDDPQKAEIVAVVDKMTNASMTEQTDFEITINKKKVDLVEYLEEQFPDADGKEACKNATRFLREQRKTQTDTCN